jgi:hypothetical protein
MTRDRSGRVEGAPSLRLHPDLARKERLQLIPSSALDARSPSRIQPPRAWPPVSFLDAPFLPFCNFPSLLEYRILFGHLGRIAASARRRLAIRLSSLPLSAGKRRAPLPHLLRTGNMAAHAHMSPF